MKKNKVVHYSIIAIFVSLYFLVATISMINSVAFFDIAHSGLMNWALAVGFELGAAASLAAIIILDKTNKAMVWGLFILLTAFQMMANSYHAFINLENYIGWIELFGLQEEELIFQKRILSIVSGAVLPLVALGFIKSLTDYIRPNDEEETEEETEDTAISDWDETINDGLNDLDAENETAYENYDALLDQLPKTPSDVNQEETPSKDTKETIEEQSTVDNTHIDANTVKAKVQGKTPSSASNFTRSDGMPLKDRQRTGDYIG